MFKCRRLLVLLVAVSVLFAATLSVSAAEPVDYSFVFDSDMGDSWFCSEFIPEGRYKVLLGDYSSDVTIGYHSNSADGYTYYTSDDFYIGFGGIELDCYLYCFAGDDSSGSFVYINNYESLFNLEVPDLIFTSISVEKPSNVSSKFSDIISGIGLNGVFSEVVSLLPVLLVVLIGFIGVRKAVSWLISVLRNS